MTEKFGTRMKDETRIRRFLDEMENMCTSSDTTATRFKRTFQNSSQEERKEMLSRLGFYLTYREGIAFHDVCTEMTKRFEDIGCINKNDVRKFIPDLFKNQYAKIKRLGKLNKTDSNGIRKNFPELLDLIMKYRYPNKVYEKSRSYYEIFEKMKLDGVLPNSWSAPSSINKFMLRSQEKGILSKDWNTKENIEKYFRINAGVLRN